MKKYLFFRYFYPKQGKTAVPKNNCHKNLLVVKKWVLCRIFVLKKESYSEKITAAKVKAKREQIQAFRGMTDLQIRDKVRSIIKTKIDSENVMQHKEELFPGN